MNLDWVSELSPDTPLVARDTWSCSHWERVLVDRDLPEPTTAWRSRPVQSWSNWLVSLWETAAENGHASGNRYLLNSHQTDCLWRRVIESSSIGRSLVSTEGVAAQARAARSLLLDAGIWPTQANGEGRESGGSPFYDWNRRFDERLNQEGWVDSDSLLYRINRLPLEALRGPAVFLDPPPRSSEARRLVTGWHAAGRVPIEAVLNQQGARCSQLLAENPLHELNLAADWAAECMDQDPESLYAVVAPDDRLADRARNVLTDRFGQALVSTTFGMALADTAVCGAALNALRLLGSAADFFVFSRWLRSPFFVIEGESVDDRAALEVELRTEPLARHDFTEAWQLHGLRDVVARRLPVTTDRLDRALKIIPRRATPTLWTGAWHECLKLLGWAGFQSGLPDAIQRSWDNSWARFSELTPVCGQVSLDAALPELLRIFSRERIVEKLPLYGLLLVDRIDRLGPACAGAWVAGCTDNAPFGNSRANQLLPWSVQAANAMAGTDPTGDLKAARDELQRLKAQIPTLVFSCPEVVADQAQTPSPLLEGWSRDSRIEGAMPGSTGFAPSRIGSRALEIEEDLAPPLETGLIEGGTRTLNLQAVCPVKAFCIARLGADRLEPPPRGIDSRLRGTLIHRALELLFDPRSSQAPQERVTASIDSALASSSRQGLASWQALLEAERTRLRQLVERFLSVEAARPEFEIVAVERREDLTIDGLRLRCRIDRIDRVTNDAELVIDYKTGQTTQTGWFEDRLADCQLPLYAQQVGPAAIAIVRLDARSVEYRGAGIAAVALPKGFRNFDQVTWQKQVERWREQLRVLVTEFAAGDTRFQQQAANFVRSDATDHAGGAFAPLSRVGDPV